MIESGDKVICEQKSWAGSIYMKDGEMVSCPTRKRFVSPNGFPEHNKEYTVDECDMGGNWLTLVECPITMKFSGKRADYNIINIKTGKLQFRKVIKHTS